MRVTSPLLIRALITLSIMGRLWNPSIQYGRADAEFQFFRLAPSNVTAYSQRREAVASQAAPSHVSGVAMECPMTESARPRAVGINHIALEVGDIEEALAFYGRIFQFELRGKNDAM